MPYLDVLKIQTRLIECEFLRRTINGHSLRIEFVRFVPHFGWLWFRWSSPCCWSPPLTDHTAVYNRSARLSIKLHYNPICRLTYVPFAFRPSDPSPCCGFPFRRSCTKNTLLLVFHWPRNKYANHAEFVTFQYEAMNSNCWYQTKKKKEQTKYSVFGSVTHYGWL